RPAVAPTKPGEFTEAARPAVAPAKPVEFTEAARPAVAPAKPVEFTEAARPAAAPAKPVEFTETARPAVAPAKPVESSEAIHPLTPAAPLESIKAPKSSTSVRGEPLERVNEPLTSAPARPTDVSASPGNATMDTEVSRAQSLIAETQKVSRSNVLAENVHKLELPANAGPELRAAKSRLQERSLLISQSADNAKVLEGMQADLKVLEKSVTPEALSGIRQDIAEMQSSSSTLERSAAQVEGNHTRLVEGSNAHLDNAQVPNRGSTEQTARVRQGETVEMQTANAAKPAQATSSAITQAPHAVSVQEQSLKLLENGELSSTSRKAASQMVQDTNGWQGMTLPQRSEAVARLDANLKILSADASTVKDLPSLTKSVEGLKLGTNVEAAAVKAEREAASSIVTERTSSSPPARSDVQTTPRTSPASGLREEANVADRNVGVAHTTSPEMRFSPTETPAAGAAVRQDLEAATAQLRGHSETLQKQALDALTEGKVSPRARKALSNVVQDSGNIGRLEGTERANALSRIEQNLKIASEDRALAVEAPKLGDTFQSLEISANKAQQLKQLDKVSSEALPRIADETAALRSSHVTHSSSSAERVGAHLDSIEKDASSLTSSADKSGALTRMQGEVNRLEGLLGKESVAPLKENVDRLEFAHRNSARANKLEETAAESANSRESLNREMRALSGADAQLSTAGKTAAEDIQGLTSTTQRLSQAEVSRLRDSVAIVSKDLEPAVGARLNSHVYNVETNHQLSQLDRTLASVAEGTVTVNRQTAVAAARNSDPVVTALHQTTESLSSFGVGEVSAVRLAYEKALPALSREDAININRSISRIENQTVEAYLLKQRIAEAQQSHIAVVERNAHWYSQNEAQRARELHQIVVSPRDRAVEEALKHAETSRNTSDLAVFKPATHAVSDVPVSGLSSKSSRWREISEAAQNIAARVRETVYGLQSHPVAASLSIGMGAFMVESGRAMAQTSADNLRQPNAGQMDFSPRSQSVPASVEVLSSRANGGLVVENGVQQPVVRGTLSAEYASLSPTIQALMRTPDGGFDPTNGQRMKFGNSFLWAAAQSGVPEEVVAKAAVYARVVKASSIPVGQPDSTDKDRSRIFYPPFKSPMASISAKVRKPQNLLGTELVSLANSTSFLNSKLSPSTTSLTNPLNFTREKADSSSEDRTNSGSVAIGGTLDLAANSSSASTALLNAASPDPNAQVLSQSAVSES
ncbi:MAG: hypothetical protein P4L53_20915, partial [Candidatus Obscuribacterales bacterium]|nr:hypothetical protein [Candidatus Obscuribacterales bacterium]